MPPGAAWRHYALAPDVQVLVQEDIAPWRARALRLAIQQFACWVNAAEDTKERQDG